MRRTVTVEDYFDAALALLIEKGPRTIKVGSLCERLGVTTGSFYGYFSGLDDFIERLITQRLSGHNRRLRELADPGASADECLKLLREMAASVPHEEEKAIRAWARSHPAASKLQREFDEQRVQALVAALLPHTDSEQGAHQLAQFGMALLVGWQELRIKATQTAFHLVFDEFERAVRTRWRLS